MADSPDERIANPQPGGSPGMNRREIASLVCKSIALLLFAEAAFLSIASVVVIAVMVFTAPLRDWFEWHQLYAALVLAIPMLAVLAVGCVYWKRADAIAARMVSPDPGPVTRAAITIQDVMMVALSVAGVFVLVGGVQDFVSILFLAHEILPAGKGILGQFPDVDGADPTSPGPVADSRGARHRSCHCLAANGRYRRAGNRVAARRRGVTCRLGRRRGDRRNCWA